VRGIAAAGGDDVFEAGLLGAMISGLHPAIGAAYFPIVSAREMRMQVKVGDQRMGINGYFWHVWYQLAAVNE